jgi:hypothetical protein
MRESDAGVRLRKDRKLLPPAEMIAAKAVREQQSGATAHAFIDDRCAIGPRETTGLRCGKGHCDGISCRAASQYVAGFKA